MDRLQEQELVINNILVVYLLCLIYNRVKLEPSVIIKYLVIYFLLSVFLQNKVITYNTTSSCLIKHPFLQQNVLSRKNKNATNKINIIKNRIRHSHTVMIIMMLLIINQQKYTNFHSVLLLIQFRKWNHSTPMQAL